MKNFEELLLSLGFVTGALHGPVSRAELIALLKSPEGARPCAYIRSLRTAITEVLEASGRGVDEKAPSGQSEH